jgi:3-phenylpropionate/trans-cinnamate dioxygenase ferredoxin subunit
MTWHRACGVGDLDVGDVVRLPLEPAVAVFNVDGDLYAISDTCTHDKSSLSEGYVDEDRVECVWHFAKFCIRTGAVLSPPARLPLSTYEVKIDGVDVLVDIPDAR